MQVCCPWRSSPRRPRHWRSQASPTMTSTCRSITLRCVAATSRIQSQDCDVECGDGWYEEGLEGRRLRLCLTYGAPGLCVGCNITAAVALWRRWCQLQGASRTLSCDEPRVRHHGCVSVYYMCHLMADHVARLSFTRCTHMGRNLPLLPCAVQIKRRGLPPSGGGAVEFFCPIIRELRPLNLVDPGTQHRPEVYRAITLHAIDTHKRQTTCHGVLVYDKCIHLCLTPACSA